jgi:hypothetical protein
MRLFAGQTHTTGTIEEFVLIQMQLLDDHWILRTGQCRQNGSFHQIQWRINEIEEAPGAVEIDTPTIKVEIDLIGVFDRRNRSILSPTGRHHRFADLADSTGHDLFVSVTILASV